MCFFARNSALAKIVGLAKILAKIQQFRKHFAIRHSQFRKFSEMCNFR